MSPVTRRFAKDYEVQVCLEARTARAQVGLVTCASSHRERAFFVFSTSEKGSARRGRRRGEQVVDRKRVARSIDHYRLYAGRPGRRHLQNRCLAQIHWCRVVRTAARHPLTAITGRFGGRRVGVVRVVLHGLSTRPGLMMH